MIIGIGSDIVQHDQNSKLLAWDTQGNFPSRILSESELALFHAHASKDNFIAGRFAAKEAILKCLGTGMQDDISLKDIDIIRSPNGQPEVKLSGKVKTLSDKFGINKWHVTITHSEILTLAFAVAERV
ncbi:MAG: holo-ACP synthase [Bacteroidota bacterium]